MRHGNLIDSQDDASDDGNFVPADPTTGAMYDVLLEQFLTAGTYTVAVSQFDNFSNGTLASGFQNDGQPTFTSSNLCSNSIFCDVTGDNRTSFFAFDLLNVDSVTVTQPGAEVVPLPAGLPLLLAGLGGLAVLRRRKD